MLELRNLIPNPKPRQGGALWTPNQNREGITVDYADSIRITSPAGVKDVYVYVQIDLDPGDYVFSAHLVSISTVEFSSSFNRVLLVAKGGSGGQSEIKNVSFSGLDKRYIAPFTLADRTTVSLRVQGMLATDTSAAIRWRDMMLVTAADQRMLDDAGITYFDGNGITSTPRSVESS